MAFLNKMNEMIIKMNEMIIKMNEMIIKMNEMIIEMNEMIIKHSSYFALLNVSSFINKFSLRHSTFYLSCSCKDSNSLCVV